MTLRRFRAHLAQAIERTGRRLANIVGDDDEALRLVKQQVAARQAAVPAPAEGTVPHAVELPPCSTPLCACQSAIHVWEVMRRAGIEVNPPRWGAFVEAQFCNCKTGEQQWV